MAEPIKISIRGSDSQTDAPTVEDFIEQVRDLVAILHGVEQALDHRGHTAIEWRITNATMNSPIALEATPFGRQHGVYVEPRAREVLHYASLGLNQLRASAVRPTYFNEAVIAKAKKLSQRVTNGLALTEIEFRNGEADFLLTPATAAQVVRHAETVLAPPKTRPYEERGSLEGYYGGISHDGYGRPILTMKSRQTGDDVKCVLTGAASKYIRERLVGEVLDGRRVRVHGVLHYKGPRRIEHIDVVHIELLPGRDKLPTLDEITDPNLTDGLRSEDYLEALRDGRLH